MDAYRDRLAELGCPALHLGVSLDNTGGLRFYERYGMRLLGEEGGARYYGMPTV